MENDEELTRLHRLQLGMLKTCVDICERHNIRYFLLGGSALGAVRHCGFIPWDDDIDIGMPRPDYERFLSMAKNELNGRLFLQTWDTDPGYPLQFAKLRDSKTTFLQKNVAHLSMNHGVSLDIFPLDGCSSSSVANKLSFFAFKVLRALYQKKIGMCSSNRLAIPIKLFSALLSKRKLKQAIGALMANADYENSTYVVNWCGSWGAKEIVANNVFGKGKRLDFDGLDVVVPAQVESYLTSLYGDFMRLPPEEKRRRPHSADVIDLGKPYTAYQKTA